MRPIKGKLLKADSENRDYSYYLRKESGEHIGIDHSQSGPLDVLLGKLVSIDSKFLTGMIHPDQVSDFKPYTQLAGKLKSEFKPDDEGYGDGVTTYSLESKNGTFAVVPDADAGQTLNQYADTTMAVLIDVFDETGYNPIKVSQFDIRQQV